MDQFDPAVHVWIRGNGKAAWRGWPESPRREAVRRRWPFVGDRDERKRLAADIQRQVLVDVPCIPAGQCPPRTVFRRTVTDVLSGYALFRHSRQG